MLDKALIEEWLLAAKGKFIACAPAKHVGLVLVGKRSIAPQAVRIGHSTHSASDAGHFTHVVDDHAVGVGKDNRESMIEAVLNRQLPGMVGGVTNTNIVRFKVLELWKGTKQLHVLYRGGIDAGSWIDVTVEWVRNEGQQL